MTRHPLAFRYVAAALFVAGLAALPSRAALFDDDEARRRIEQTNQRIALVQKQLEDRIAALEAQLKSQGLVELFSQVEQLKSDIARLRGQIEVLNHEQEQAQKRQRDLYIDLDSRLRRLEGAPGAGSSPAAVGAGAPAGLGALPSSALPPVNPLPAPAPVAVAPPASATVAPRPSTITPEVANEQRAYDAAFDQFRGNNFSAAIASFGAFVKTYPKSPLAPSAQYWIGNSHFAQRDYRAAIVSQRQLVAAFPDSQKVPDALLNIATSQFELGDGAASRRTLEELIAKYPQSEAAVKARQRLAIR